MGNLDVTIIAQAPKMRPHIDAMRAKIAEDLQCDIEQVNVKAVSYTHLLKKIKIESQTTKRELSLPFNLCS